MPEVAFFIAGAVVSLIATVVGAAIGPIVQGRIARGGAKQRGRVALLHLLQEVGSLRDAVGYVESRWIVKHERDVATLTSSTSDPAEVLTIDELNKMLSLLPSIVAVVAQQDNVTRLTSQKFGTATSLEDRDKRILQSATETLDEVRDTIRDALRR